MIQSTDRVLPPTVEREYGRKAVLLRQMVSDRPIPEGQYELRSWSNRPKTSAKFKIYNTGLLHLLRLLKESSTLIDVEIGTGNSGLPGTTFYFLFVGRKNDRLTSTRAIHCLNVPQVSKKSLFV